MPEGQVLGASYFGPVDGTPLIPPGVLTYYFLFFIAVLIALYLYLHHKKRPQKLWGKIKLFAAIAIFLKLFFVVGGGALAAYWLLPAPSVLETLPNDNHSNFPLNQQIEILLDRPISRSSVEKSISPEVPGIWLFENSIYQTHLYRKLVFYPTTSLRPDTEYSITLSNIKNALKTTQSEDYTFKFRTQPPPQVLSVYPMNDKLEVAISDEIVVNLTQKNDQVSQYSFDINPPHPVNTKLDETKRTYTLTPREPFKQGTKYTITANKSDLVWNLVQNVIVENGATTQEHKSSFTTKEAPGIESFSPTGTGVIPTTPITIVFSQAMDQSSVRQNLSIEPKINGRFEWLDERTLNFIPNTLPFDTTYEIKLASGTKSLPNGFLESDSLYTFTTIGPVRVANFTPENNKTAVAVNNPIKVKFDQEVDKLSAENSFVIDPQVNGSFSWEGNSLVFKPSSPFSFSTKYKVSINTGVKTVGGQNSNQIFEASFTTQEQTVKLSVPAYLQRYSLSCEIAALRMALAFKGVDVSEDTLISQVGVDETPHNGNIWGNPYEKFVGNIRGRQMADGYGVYWGPIARVARLYKSAQEFQGWSTEQLTTEIAKGNPVVIWVYSKYGRTTSWNTPSGQYIYAVRDEHAVTAVGFVGPANNPSQMIINDPLVGQVYWPRSLFDSKWGIFNNSGVVVY